MDWARLREGIVEKGIIAILSIALGYFFGTSELATIKSLAVKNAERLDRWDKTADGRRQFMNNAVRRIEFMCDRDPDCRTRFEPMEVPE